MSNCPFLIDSVWSEHKCKALSPARYPGEDLHKFCGTEWFSEDYHDCPLFQEKTGTRKSGGLLLNVGMHECEI